MKAIKNITFIHLLNDYSGSPLVLSNVIRGMQEYGYNCQLITSANSEGFLSNLDGVSYDLFNYRFHENKLVRLVLYFWTQFIIFLKILSIKKSHSLIYINTLLPFGAALGAWIKGHKVIYHIHETSLKPLILKRFLKWVANFTSDYSIYVSEHLRQTEALPDSAGATIHNALSDLFKTTAEEYKTNDLEESQSFNVLMLCSLKRYKGVLEFVKLAEMLPEIHFSMVINSEQSAIDQFFKKVNIPSNLELFSSQKNVHPFYKKSHLVLNLSHPEQWVETFGMTILEGMYYGLPCIAPPVGGPTEIVENAINGYLIDQRNLDEIAQKIIELAEDENLYNSFSQNALKRAMEFNFEAKIAEINDILSVKL